MSIITNEPKIDQDDINGIRKALEHRATWFYLLLAEAKKNGLDWETIGRPAIRACGGIHGKRIVDNCSDISDVRKFAEQFADETGQKVFEMETIKNDGDNLSLDFHYCPLVSAWKKLGCTDEEIVTLCDIAMDGDRGIISQCEGYCFELESTIAAGAPVCKIRIKKN